MWGSARARSSIYLLYSCKSTNTDADGAGSQHVPNHARAIVSKYYSAREVDALVERAREGEVAEAGRRAEAAGGGGGGSRSGEGEAEGGEGGRLRGLVGGVQDVPWERWTVETAAQNNLVRSQLSQDRLQRMLTYAHVC